MLVSRVDSESILLQCEEPAMACRRLTVLPPLPGRPRSPKKFSRNIWQSSGRCSRLRHTLCSTTTATIFATRSPASSQGQASRWVPPALTLPPSESEKVSSKQQTCRLRLSCTRTMLFLNATRAQASPKGKWCYRDRANCGFGGIFVQWR